MRRMKPPAFPQLKLQLVQPEPSGALGLVAPRWVNEVAGGGI